ncbi:MAG: hypothetical protein GY826_12595 [Fuerstiella sp.]|nr:hypothetical protein [Fuerstiella sp.]
MTSSIDEFLSSLDDNPDEVNATTAVVEPPSATAMKTDKWHHRLGSALAERWGVKSVTNVVDAHTACFEPNPQLARVCADKVRHKWYTDLLQSADFKALHVSTRSDRSLSEIAAKQIVDRFERYRSALSEEDIAAMEDAADDDEDPRETIERNRGIGAAVDMAQEEVNQAIDCATAFGLGKGDSGGTDPAAVMNTYQAIRDDYTLRKIADNAGRFIRMAKSMQRQKPTHGMDDVVGVELAGDVSRMLPTETALLDTELEVDLLRRLQEQQVMCREYKGKESLGRGPIMVLVDESSSMTGEPIAAAKGFALAMAWLARHQNRWCCLVGWSSRGEVRELVMKPGESSPDLMNWCGAFLRGGTYPPLAKVPELFEQTGAPKGKTDVIWITDGECNPHGVEGFNKWREAHDVKTWTIGIGCKARSFHSFSDEVTKVTDLDTGQPIVADLLSL